MTQQELLIEHIKKEQIELNVQIIDKQLEFNTVAKELQNLKDREEKNAEILDILNSKYFGDIIEYYENNKRIL